MFDRIDVWHYKCVKQASVRLEPFNILIGPNASGKSTFLDTLGFVRDALETDIEEAIRRRANSLQELVWQQADAARGFEMAVEVNIPTALRTANGYDRVRYEVGVGLEQGSIVVTGENLWLMDSAQNRPPADPAPTLFPLEPDDRETVVRPARSHTPAGRRLVVRKIADSGNDYFRSERTDWNISFRLAPRRLTLSGVPEDQERFPIALWFRDVLWRNVQALQLNSVVMRRPCPADAPRTFQPDGSNLPLLVDNLRRNYEDRFQWWIGHLQTILEDLMDVKVIERPEDRSRYLLVEYRTGLRIPAWLLSDGTLRLLALTLMAYLPQPNQVFITEEPENGIHPRAIESVYQALSSVYDGQVLLATHSPLILALAEPTNLLIFGKTTSGATAVLRGTEHPTLREWQREVPLETLFAAGVLG